MPRHGLFRISVALALLALGISHSEESNAQGKRGEMCTKVVAQMCCDGRLLSAKNSCQRLEMLRQGCSQLSRGQTCGKPRNPSPKGGGGGPRPQPPGAPASPATCFRPKVLVTYLPPKGSVCEPSGKNCVGSPGCTKSKPATCSCIGKVGADAPQPPPQPQQQPNPNPPADNSHPGSSPGKPSNTRRETEPDPKKSSCGDRICQSIVCFAIGCPKPETPENCPQDCDPNWKGESGSSQGDPGDSAGSGTGQKKPDPQNPPNNAPPGNNSADPPPASLSRKNCAAWCRNNGTCERSVPTCQALGCPCSDEDVNCPDCVDSSASAPGGNRFYAFGTSGRHSGPSGADAGGGAPSNRNGGGDAAAPPESRSSNNGNNAGDGTGEQPPDDQQPQPVEPMASVAAPNDKDERNSEEELSYESGDGSGAEEASNQDETREESNQDATAPRYTGSPETSTELSPQGSPSAVPAQNVAAIGDEKDEISEEEPSYDDDDDDDEYFGDKEVSKKNTDPSPQSSSASLPLTEETVTAEYQRWLGRGPDQDELAAALSLAGTDATTSDLEDFLRQTDEYKNRNSTDAIVQLYVAATGECPSPETLDTLQKLLGAFSPQDLSTSLVQTTTASSAASATSSSETFTVACPSSSTTPEDTETMVATLGENLLRNLSDPFKARKAECDAKKATVEAALKTQEMLIEGTRSRKQRAEEEFESAKAGLVNNFISGISGATEAAYKTVQAESDLLIAQMKQRSELEKKLQDFDCNSVNAAPQVVLQTPESMKADAVIKELLQNSSGSLRTTETSLKNTQNAAVAGGAMVVVLLSGGTASPALLALYGTGAGTGIGVLTAGAEGASNVLVGNKDVPTAAKVAAFDALGYTYTAGVSAVSAATGLAAAKGLSQVIASSGASGVQLLVYQLAAGATAGGASSIVGNLNKAPDYVSGTLTTEEFLRMAGMDTLFGLLGGTAGAATTSVTKQALADAVLAVTQLWADNKLTTEGIAENGTANFLNILTSALVGAKINADHQSQGAQRGEGSPGNSQGARELSQSRPEEAALQNKPKEAPEENGQKPADGPEAQSPDSSTSRSPGDPDEQKSGEPSGGGDKGAQNIATSLDALPLPPKPIVKTDLPNLENLATVTESFKATLESLQSARRAFDQAENYVGALIEAKYEDPSTKIDAHLRRIQEAGYITDAELAKAAGFDDIGDMELYLMRPLIAFKKQVEDMQLRYENMMQAALAPRVKEVMATIAESVEGLSKRGVFVSVRKKNWGLDVDLVSNRDGLLISESYTITPEGKVIMTRDPWPLFGQPKINPGRKERTPNAKPERSLPELLLLIIDAGTP